MAWGRNSAEQRRNAVENGGTLSGRQAKRAARQGGVDTTTNKVKSPRGKTTGRVSGREKDFGPNV